MIAGRQAGAARAVHRDAEPVEEQGPVGQLGQGVLQRLVGEPHLGALALHRVAQRARQQRGGREVARLSRWSCAPARTASIPNASLAVDCEMHDDRRVGGRGAEDRRGPADRLRSGPEPSRTSTQLTPPRPSSWTVSARSRAWITSSPPDQTSCNIATAAWAVDRSSSSNSTLAGICASGRFRRHAEEPPCQTACKFSRDRPFYGNFVICIVLMHRERGDQDGGCVYRSSSCCGGPGSLGGVPVSAPGSCFCHHPTSRHVPALNPISR